MHDTLRAVAVGARERAGHLARGSIEAVFTFHPDVWEQDGGTLLARETGAAVHADGAPWSTPPTRRP